MHRTAQFVSNIFHPLLILTLVALVICYFTPVLVLPFNVKAFFVGIVSFYTFLLPVLIIVLMHVFHVVGHWALRDRRDRVLPLLINCICYAVNAAVLRRYGFFPLWVLNAFYGSVILAFVAWIITFWWKISAHTAANAAAATYITLLSFAFPDMIPLWLLLGSYVLVGLIGTIRIYLGRHTLAQVGCGTLLGIVSILLGWGIAPLLPVTPIFMIK